MPDTYLVLGGYTFSGFGVPERVNGGGAQQLTVHKMLGGARVIDAMGADDDCIRFMGRFRGAGAMDDAALMDQLRIAGAQVQFSYWNLEYTVVVQKFEYSFERFYEVPYHLELVVLTNQLQQNVQPDPSLDQAVSSDIYAGAGAAAGNPDCASAFDTLTTSYAENGPLDAATGALQSVANAAADAVSTAQQAVQSTLDGIAQAADIVTAPINDLISTVNGAVQQIPGALIGANLTALADKMTAGASAQVTLPFVGRIGLNVSASLGHGLVVSS